MKTKTYVKGVAALCALAAVACTGVQQSRGDVAVYLDESQPLEKRVEDALSRMTLEEKVGLLHAQSKFSSAGVPRLGIPEVVQLYIGDKLSSQPRPVKELKGLKRYTSRPARAEPSRSKSTPGCSPVTTMRKGSGALNPVNSPLMSAPRRTTSAERARPPGGDAFPAARNGNNPRKLDGLRGLLLLASAAPGYSAAMRLRACPLTESIP